MNEITLLREAGPEAPPLTAAARSAARAALLAEIEAADSGRGRFPLPSPKVRWRIGLAVTTPAAAWTAAVVVSAPDEPGPPPTSVTLVAFEPPVFPLSVDPVPPGLTPTFSADPGGILQARYGSGDGGSSFGIQVSPDEPEQHDVTGTDEVTIGDREGELVSGVDLVCGGPGPECVDVERPYVHLVVQWRDDLWVQVSGQGRYDDGDRLVALARALVDEPQPVPLQVHLAPAGWSVLAYKDDRILTLVNDAYEQQTLTVHLPLPDDVIPADRLLSELMGPVGPVIDVTVHDRPAHLVQIGGGPLDSGWFLQAQFPDGTTFVVQAPAAFTQDEVIRFAGEVTHSQ